jgi:undecaprenyl-diphosphatase
MSLTYVESITVGLLQGVTELFPISSLGHSVLLPALLGGAWGRDLDVSADGSPYLSVLVGLHLATAVALVVFFRRDWVRIVGGLFTSLRYRSVETPDEKLAWLLVVATIPVGVAGLLLDHLFRAVLGKPVPAAMFLTANGLVLYLAERMRRGGGRHRGGIGAAEPAARRTRDVAYASATSDLGATVPDILGDRPSAEAGVPTGTTSDQRLARLSFAQATWIGAAQILALLPGISRSGVTMGAGLLRGLTHEDAARFSFLLATPVIAAAALLKLPGLLGPAGAGIRGPLLAGSLAAFTAGYLSVRFLIKYFETRTLTPFALYCTLAGLGSLAYFTLT